MVLKRYSLSLVVVFSSFMSFGNLAAAPEEQAPAPAAVPAAREEQMNELRRELNELEARDARRRRQGGIFSGGYGWGNPQQQSKSLQKAQAAQCMIENINDLKDALNGKGLDDAQRKAYGNAIQGLYDELAQMYSRDAKLGQAIAVGLAGSDKGIDGIGNWVEGLEIGLAMRFAGACGEVMKTRITGAADTVLGGTWDFIVGNLIDGWKRIQEILFHNGLKPFTVDELKGWQKHFEICFLDVERLVKDGVKDVLRGHDMSLRKAEDAGDEPQVQQQRTNVWRLLITGYVRQIEYFVRLIDKRIGYYLEEEDPDSNELVLEDPILYYAKEIKQRLIETMAVLQECHSVKELDAALDSSKHLIPAMNKNIQALMTRLIAEVTPKSYSLLTKDTGMPKEPPAPKGNGGGMSMENDNYPNGMNNSWN